jgi:hypothetical protein
VTGTSPLIQKRKFVQRAFVFTTIQPEWNLGPATQRQRKVVIGQREWREIQRLCRAAGNHSVDDDVHQVGRGDRFIAMTLRRLLAGTRVADELRGPMEELAALAERSLGLKVALEDVHRHEFHQEVQSAPKPVAPAESPGTVYRQ